jgi:hypothetical protein
MLGAFQKIVRRIFRAKKENKTGGWKEMLNFFCSLHSSPSKLGLASEAGRI